MPFSDTRVFNLWVKEAKTEIMEANIENMWSEVVECKGKKRRRKFINNSDILADLFTRITGHITRDHSFSTFGKFSEKLIFFTPRDAHVRLRIRG